MRSPLDAAPAGGASRFQPVHCEDSADARHLLDLPWTHHSTPLSTDGEPAVEIEPDRDCRYLNCDDTWHCQHTHPVVEQALSAVPDWLARLPQALSQGTLTELLLPHADPGHPWPVRVHGIDPTTAHLVIAVSRQGHERAAALYVGLVAQGADSIWRGLAGLYCSLCPHCDPEGSHQASDAAAQIMNASPFVTVDDHDSRLWAVLADWFDGRAVAVATWEPAAWHPAAFTPSGPDPAWTLLDLRQPGPLPAGPLLAHLGQNLTAAAQWMLLRDGQALARYAPLLFGQSTRPQLLSVRSGDVELLRRLAGEPAQPAVPARPWRPSGGQPPPLEWGVRVLTATGQDRLVELMRCCPDPPAGPGQHVEYWCTPRLSARGAIEGTALLELYDRLRADTTLNPS